MFANETADSESGRLDSYSSFLITIRLSRWISEIFACDRHFIHQILDKVQQYHVIPVVQAVGCLTGSFPSRPTSVCLRPVLLQAESNAGQRPLPQTSSCWCKDEQQSVLHPACQQTPAVLLVSRNRSTTITTHTRRLQLSHWVSQNGDFQALSAILTLHCVLVTFVAFT